MSEVTYNRVNWEDSPSTNTPITASNLNVMDKGISDCAAAVNGCFQSASNGKALIAAALTGKGQSSTSADTFAQMAAKIGNLMAVPTAKKTITANGSDIDVTNYGKVDVAVPENGTAQYSAVTYPSEASFTLNHKTNRIYVISNIWQYTPILKVNGIQKTLTDVGYIGEFYSGHGVWLLYCDGDFKIGDIISATTGYPNPIYSITIIG